MTTSAWCRCRLIETRHPCSGWQSIAFGTSELRVPIVSTTDNSSFSYFMADGDPAAEAIGTDDFVVEAVFQLPPEDEDG